LEKICNEPLIEVKESTKMKKFNFEFVLFCDFRIKKREKGSLIVPVYRKLSKSCDVRLKLELNAKIINKMFF